MPRRTSPLIRPLRAYGRRAGAKLHITVVLGGEQVRVHSFDGMSRAMRELVSELTTADPLERRAVLGVLIRLAQRMQDKRAPRRAPVVVGPQPVIGADGIPILETVQRGELLIVPACPFCRERHTYGIVDDDDPLPLRGRHCVELLHSGDTSRERGGARDFR